MNAQITDDTNLKEGDFITAKKTAKIERFEYKYFKNAIPDYAMEEYIYITKNKRYEIVHKNTQIITEGAYSDGPLKLTHNINILDDKGGRASFKIVINLKKNDTTFPIYPVIKQMGSVALIDQFLYDYFYTPEELREAKIIDLIN